jgi:hypothetical protein
LADIDETKPIDGAEVLEIEKDDTIFNSYKKKEILVDFIVYFAVLVHQSTHSRRQHQTNQQRRCGQVESINQKGLGEFNSCCE